MGLVQWKRASSRVEAGTSRFLSISDSDHRFPEELGQESQSSSCVEEWNSASLSSCLWVKGHFSSCVLNLRVFPDDALGSQCPVELLLTHCSEQGPHLVMTGEPRGFSRVEAGFPSYEGEFRLSLVLDQGSPIFHSSWDGKLGIALESLQNKKYLI